MKKKLNKRYVIIAILAIVAFVLGTISGYAQNFQGLNTLQNVASEGQNAGKYVINIAFVFSGIVGAIMVIPGAIKAFKGEPNSRDAITNIGLGLISVFIILSIIKVAMAFS